MITTKHKLIFFGTPEFAVPSLGALVDAGFEIVAVVTTPDELTGRSGKITPSPIKLYAQEVGINVLQPKSLNDDTFFNLFKRLSPDICIIVAYGKIIPSRYLEIVKYGFINIHPSLLPKYRGPSPIQSAILNGDAETGISIMKIDKEMDHGPILISQKYEIPVVENFINIEKSISQMSAQLLIKILPEYLKENLLLFEQNHSEASYVKKYSRQDGRIDWSKSAVQVYNLIRALNPNPGVWTTINGKTLNIIEANIVDYDSKERVVRDSSQLLIRADDKYLSITILQLEGKKVMPINSFLNGYHENTIIIQ